MTARQPTQLTTSTGAPLPLPAMPQDRLLTVNVEQIPLLKDILGIPGIHIQPLRLDAERGEWVFMAVCAPGCYLPIHYHTGTAQVYTLQGRWCYREYPDQPQTAGSYLYEPAGSVHTFYTPRTTPRTRSPSPGLKARKSASTTTARSTRSMTRSWFSI